MRNCASFVSSTFLCRGLEDAETEQCFERGDLLPKFGGWDVQLLRRSRIVQLFRQGDCRSFQTDGNSF
jgi:hypothetical protein